MLPTSGTYNFQSVQIELLIREAYERIGITGEFLDTLKLESARRSINLLLIEWMEKTTNLWSLQTSYLSLIPGQFQYNLSANLLDIVQVNLRNSTRQISPVGLAQSNKTTSYDNAGGGVPANAFNGDITAGCIQTELAGNISYDFGINNPGPQQTINTPIITFIGIQSNVTKLNTITVERSNGDPADATSWIPIITIPTQVYIEGVTEWFDVKSPAAARYYRIRETEQVTLNIRQIFNNNNTFDFNISNVSRYEYGTYPNKYLQSRPNVYYLDRQIAPILNIWPAPAPQYNCLSYSYKKMLQDATFYTDTIEIPAKMYPALIWGLTYYLALKFNPPLAEMAEGKYERSFASSIKEDTEDTDISIRGE